MIVTKRLSEHKKIGGESDENEGGVCTALLLSPSLSS